MFLDYLTLFPQKIKCECNQVTTIFCIFAEELKTIIRYEILQDSRSITAPYVVRFPLPHDRYRAHTHAHRQALRRPARSRGTGLHRTLPTRGGLHHESRRGNDCEIHGSSQAGERTL